MNLKIAFSVYRRMSCRDSLCDERISQAVVGSWVAILKWVAICMGNSDVWSSSEVAGFRFR